MNKKKYISGKITKINENFFTFITKKDKRGFVYMGDISDYYIRDISSLFMVGEIVELLVKQYKRGDYFCDFKHGRADFLKSPFQYDLKETEGKFNNLYKFNDKEVLKWKK